MKNTSTRNIYIFIDDIFMLFHNLSRTVADYYVGSHVLIQFERAINLLPMFS